MKMIFVLIMVLILIPVSGQEKSNFYAFYTKIKSGEDWEKHSKTAEHADLVVQLNTGQIIFHRASSYLPFWKTEEGKWYFDEVVSRNGDGPQKRPDKNNIYSFVRLIESNSDSIIVHWRYFPDFKLGNHAQPVAGNIGFDGVVHEYFTIFPNGRVNRIIREGTEKLDDWHDAKNRTVQTLQLRSNGITEINIRKAYLSKAKLNAVSANKVRSSEIESALSWHFDEGMKSRSYDLKDVTFESQTGKRCPIDGPKTVWKKGVSGTALGFDGYNSKVTAPSLSINTEGEEGGFTIEAWVAPGAYSICEWTAIAHQSVWEADVRENHFQIRNWGDMQLGEKIKKGFFLGIDEFGHPGCFVVLDQETAKVQSFESLPLYEWAHVAMTLVGEGMLYLYINGELANFTNFSGELVPADVDFLIGMNNESIGYVSQHVVRTYSTFPSPLGFEGLIDEVKYYSEFLDHKEIRESYLSLKPKNPEADMQPRTLPGMEGHSKEFGAQYTHLKYHDLWDNMWREPEHPDIVVKFDLMPTSVVFWRGSRSPGWVTETNKWISDQSSELTDWHWENHSEGAQSCCEHMSDYQARHSHVRIIENSPARTVVHWRYASVDVLYKHPNTCRNEDGWGVWTDEYLTIYPDGVGVRTVDQHGDLDYYHYSEGGEIGFHDTQFLSEAGTKPEDNINPQSLTIVSHKDKITELDWSNGHPAGEYDAQVIWINLKSEFKVFEIFPPGTGINVWAEGEKTSYSNYSAWNHYPVTQAPCDGRFCVAPDRLTHSALGAADNLTETGNMLLYGFTDQPAQSLIPLARSWNHAPELTKINGGRSEGYSKKQRAWIISAESDMLTFSVNASKKSPLINPAFIIKNWNRFADIQINNKSDFTDKDIRQGLIRNTSGESQLIIWINMKNDKKSDIFIKIKK
jgi:hypothetical protein